MIEHTSAGAKSVLVPKNPYFNTSVLKLFVLVLKDEGEGVIRAHGNLRVSSVGRDAVLSGASEAWMRRVPMALQQVMSDQSLQLITYVVTVDKSSRIAEAGPGALIDIRKQYAVSSKVGLPMPH